LARFWVPLSIFVTLSLLDTPAAGGVQQAVSHK
jgi:hypothetical protein